VVVVVAGAKADLLSGGVVAAAEAKPS